MSKKGQSGFVAIISFIIIAMIASLLLTFGSTLSAQTYSIVEPQIREVGNKSVTEETVLADAAAISGAINVSKNFKHSSIHSGTLTLQNATSYNIGLDNFTIDYTAGTYLLTAENLSYVGALYANYSWGLVELQDTINSGIKSGFSTTETTAKYLPIIIISMIVMLIMGFVFTMSSMFNNRGIG